MKCPKCSYISFDYLDLCKKCGKDLTEDKARFGIRSIKKKATKPVEKSDSELDALSEVMPPDILEVPESQPLGGDEESFSLDDISFDDLGNEVDSDIEEEISFDSDFEPILDTQSPANTELEKTVIMPSHGLDEEWSKESDEEESSLSFGEENSEDHLVDEPAFWAAVDDEVSEAPEIAEDEKSGSQTVQDGDSEEFMAVDDNVDDVDLGEISLLHREEEVEEASFYLDDVDTEELLVADKKESLDDCQITLSFTEKKSDTDEVDENPPKEVDAISNIEGTKKGGFFRRAFAYTVDNIILSLILYAFIMAGVYALQKGVSSDGEGLAIEHIVSLVGPVTFLSFFVSAAYFTFFHWATGQTPGKMMFGLKVVMKDGRPLTLGKSFLRWFGYTVSALPLMLGYILVLIDKQKQSLHDKIAGTYVVNMRALPKEEEIEVIEEVSSDVAIEEEISFSRDDS